MLGDEWILDHPKHPDSVIKVCPACGSSSVRRVPVAYGLIVNPEFHERVARGEVVWGGCVVGAPTPVVLRCDDCSRFWAPEGEALAAHMEIDHGQDVVEFNHLSPAPRVEMLRWRHFTLHKALQSRPERPSVHE